MSLVGPYVHHIDPVIASVLGVHLWWYGFSYTLGFLNAYRYLRSRREQFGLSLHAVYDLSILLATGVLLGGRIVEVIFYEWPFYREHLELIPAYWLGGMATHGLLLGGLVGIWAFCRLAGRRFLEVTDALVIPAAVIMGLGRIGNFIDGQIVGSVTSVWWAVKFPDAGGFRHPVVLYDGLKNLLIAPLLMITAGRRPPCGVQTGIFLFLYAFLRIFVDVFREYPTTLLGLATGQVLNLLMSLLGLALIIMPLWSSRHRAGTATPVPDGSRHGPSPAAIGWRGVAFAGLLIFSLVLPSDWTQDIPARYGGRHPGLDYSALYPKIDTHPEPDRHPADAQAAPHRPGAAPP